jgi:hypothetical protein
VGCSILALPGPHKCYLSPELPGVLVAVILLLEDLHFEKTTVLMAARGNRQV